MKESLLCPALPTFTVLFGAPLAPVVTETSTASASAEDQLQPKE
jgi:hypothetical protein